MRAEVLGNEVSRNHTSQSSIWEVYTVSVSAIAQRNNEPVTLIVAYL